VVEKKSQIDTPGRKEFLYTFPNDTNGIVYYLKKHSLEDFRVSASSIGRGLPAYFVKRDDVYCWTTNVPDSWFMVDFGEKRTVTPNYYSFRYASGGNACCPRNWLLQGCSKLGDLKDNWITLSEHLNDTTINQAHATACYPLKLNNTHEFRYLRIIQNGPNAETQIGGWAHVLVASGFEVYGTLHTHL